jgi:nucleoside-diphosphate-sugar epimerase
MLGGGFLSTILIDHAKKNNIDHILIDRISCDFSSPNCIKYLKSKVPAGSPLMLLASVTRLRGNSFDEFNENIKIVHNILDFNKFNRGHLIYYSSIDVYGENPSLPISEKLDLIPRDYYSLSKIVSEFMIQDLIHRKQVFPFTILRLTGIYGEAMNDRSVIGQMVSTSILKGNIEIVGSGESLRDYVWAEDVAIITETSILNSIQGIFNVATGTSQSIINIAKIISKRLNSNIKINDNQINLRNNSLVFQINKLKLFYPEINLTHLELGIDKYIKYYINR